MIINQFIIKCCFMILFYVHIIFLLSEDSFKELKKLDPNFLSRFSSWIQSPNKHIQISAGLALGNYAGDGVVMFYFVLFSLRAFVKNK